MFLFSNFATTLVQSTIVAMLVVQFRATNYLVGSCFAALGCFGIVGYSLFRVLVSKFQSCKLIAGLTAVSGFMTALSVFHLSFASFTALWGFTVLVGAINVTAFVTYRQANISAQLTGRVVSASRVMTYVPIPFAAVLVGLIFDHFGNDAVMLTSAAVRQFGVIIASSVLLYTSIRRTV